MSDDVNIEQIIDELGLSDEKKDEVSVKVQNGEIDVEELTSIAEGLVTMVKDDREKADDLFDLFYIDLAKGTDKTTASKETIAKALELKIEASKNIIELMKIKAKIQEGNVGVFINTRPSKKAGIDIGNLREATKDES